ncbi:MAG: ABC transporter substrate-binding protein [Deltaproteobacteria bacterium]|nr:ABC transporter substrate-binding protein [Deltaproteobacteria bacterium]MBI3076953.1 ABC transporter substrate-binding protein [Deltaproteobacteria bacterium]
MLVLTGSFLVLPVHLPAVPRTGEAVAGPAPLTGGTLIYGKPKDAVKLDPHNVTDGESFDVTRQIFDTLVQFREGTTEVEPALATSWRVSRDGLAWTFMLRRGVRFHDGTPFTAKAVVTSFERQMFKHHPHHRGPFEYWASMFGGYPGIVTRVRALDEQTVRFELSRPSAPFLANLAMPFAAIMSPAALERYGEDIFKHPIGTGPFSLVEWLPNERVVLQANRGHWAGRPYLDRLIFKPILENSVRLLELEAGTIHGMHGINTDDVPRIQRNPALVLHTQTGMNVGYLAFNTEKPLFRDRRVRQALSHAVDKARLVKGLFGAYGVPAQTPLPPVIWGHHEGIRPYTYDPERARRLLAEAGHPRGFRADLWAMSVARPYMPDARKVAEVLQAQFRAVGVEVRIVSYEWGAYLERSRNGEHDMLLLGWTGDNGDPDNFLYTLLSSDAAVRGSANNLAFFRDRRLDDVLRRAQALNTREERAPLYRKAQELIHEEAPWIPLVHSVQLGAVRRGVRGYALNPTGDHRFHRVWLEQPGGRP